MATASLEGQGSFYLGRVHDPERGERTDTPVLYDSRDLVTHAVCVGMTGSGKTGLGTVLLEEAALDGIPALVIDPKGDLANLLLTFPELRAEDFRPWVDPGEARRKEVSEDELAARTAERWREGLTAWSQDGARIARLRAAADFSLYTPGSTAAAPLSILSSFAAPPRELAADAELLRERVASTATALLSLVGVDADPITSREHILLSTLLERAWGEGRDVELAALIREVQDPPVQKVGVLDLESFFPSKERFGLALQLNNLLAAPGFATWMEGDALDVEALLHTPAGRPRVTVLSIAHLSDTERMFFVALLLGEVLAWVRRQPGTTSLRAILYMDEIAGYFPPVANPPSKAPLLTLMKQARAFGLGVVLATQNPVDIDYKGLSNAGTWFVGRLQTERDKARLLDGLEGAAAGGTLDRGALERTLSRLDTRVFLMNNVHEDHPLVFETRWALSYLRGPLTRAQLKQLVAARVEQSPAQAAATAPERAAPPPAPVAREPSARRAEGRPPVLPPDVPQVYLPVRGALPPDARLAWRPHVLGLARVHWADSKTGARAEREVALLAPCAEGPTGLDWAAAGELELDQGDLADEPALGGTFADPPDECARARSYKGWARSLANHLYRTRTLDLWKSPSLGLVSRPYETERDFRLRLAHAAREEREAETDKLRRRYAPKLAVMDDRIRRASRKVDVQADQARQAKVSTLLSFGSALLGVFTGRKLASTGNASRAATAARGASRSAKEAADVERARADVAALERKRADLESEFEAEAAALGSRIDPDTERLETLRLAPKKRDCVVRSVALAWAPFAIDAGGVDERAW